MLSNNRSCFALDTFFEHIAIADTLKEFSAFHPNMGPIFHHLHMKMSLLHKYLFVLLVLRIIYGITDEKKTTDCGADEPYLTCARPCDRSPAPPNK